MNHQGVIPMCACNWVGVNALELGVNESGVITGGNANFSSCKLSFENEPSTAYFSHLYPYTLGSPCSSCSSKKLTIKRYSLELRETPYFMKACQDRETYVQCSSVWVGVVRGRRESIDVGAG